MVHGRSGCLLAHPKGTDGNVRAPRYLERRTIHCYQRLLSKGALKFFYQISEV